MHENNLYEYAVIRVVPRVEREEFVNVGVVVFSKRGKYLNSIIEVNEEKIRALDPHADLETIGAYLRSFEKVCCGRPEGGALALEDQASRFRWLTAVRSTIIQTSRPRQGFSEDLDKTLKGLYKEMVLSPSVD